MELVTRYLQLIILLAFLIPVIIFFFSQYRTLESIHPGNRKMPPGQVWLQCIPLFGLAWQFVVIGKIADSLRDELNTPTDDSIFSEDTVPANVRPTYNIGIAYAIFACLTPLPFPLFKGLIALAGLVLWIIYWVQLAGYKKKIKKRSILA